MTDIPSTIPMVGNHEAPDVPGWIPLSGPGSEPPPVQGPQTYIAPLSSPGGLAYSAGDQFGPRQPLTPPVGDEDLSVRLLTKRYPFAPIIALSDLRGRLPKVDVQRDYGVLFMGGDGLPYWLPSGASDPSEALPMVGGGGSVAERKSLQSSLTAGDVIPGHRAVMADLDGRARLAEASDPLLPGVIGVSKCAALPGDPVVVVTGGELESEGWNWTPGPVFLAGGGKLTQHPSEAGWLYGMGQALAPTIMIVNPTMNPIWQG